MILSYKKQFVQPILDGTKIHTIREDPHDRWHAGRKIHHATGVRTPNYNCFKEDECTGTQDIIMTYAHGDILEVSIDDKYFYWEEKRQLALYDGFENWMQMFDWFYPLIEKSPNEHFAGKIIHWTDHRY